jgi:hypothetical protein
LCDGLVLLLLLLLLLKFYRSHHDGGGHSLLVRHFIIGFGMLHVFGHKHLWWRIPLIQLPCLQLFLLVAGDHPSIINDWSVAQSANGHYQQNSLHTSGACISLDAPSLKHTLIHC